MFHTISTQTHSYVSNIITIIYQKIHIIYLNFTHRSGGHEYSSNISTACIMGHTYTNNIDILNRIKSLIYMSYRQGFDGLSEYYTDAGWGCTLRASQMLFAETLSRFGNDEMDTLLHFMDNSDSPLSIHNLLQNSHKSAGDWFGSTESCHLISAAAAKVPGWACHDIGIYISNSGLLDITMITPHTLVLITCRLGYNNIETKYITCLQRLLSHKLSVGIIGGYRNKSCYIVGYTFDDESDDPTMNVIFLDPHKVQDISPFNINTYHCSDCNTMPVTKMSPTITAGFYISNTKEASEFINFVNEISSWPDAVIGYIGYDDNVNDVDDVDDIDIL
jgi:cysteine protease ATG4